MERQGKVRERKKRQGAVAPTIALLRTPFLAGGVVLHALGVAIALYTGARLNLPALLLTQVVITSTQLMTHVSNEYFDLDTDRQNPTPTLWAGGSRVLPNGQVPPKIALWLAALFATIAVTAGMILALLLGEGHTLGIIIGTALFLAWSYSAPPLRLHSRGLGEITVAIVVTGLTPLLGFYVQAGQLALLPILAVVPLCCMQFAMMFTVEFPDAESDAATGKHTLVVRLGSAAGTVHNLVLLCAYLLPPLLVRAGLPPQIAGAIYITLPIAAWQIWRISRGAWRRPAAWNALAFAGITMLMGTAALETAAFIERTVDFVPYL